MRLQIGDVYVSRGGLIFLCVEECEAETMRFKKKEPGYRLLFLLGPKAGSTVVVPCGANVTVGVKRLD